MGVRYEFGLGGVEGNREEARLWYEKAAKQGHEEARDKLRILESRQRR